MRWWQGLSPRRRVLLGAVAALVVITAAVVGVRAAVAPGPPSGVPAQDKPGTVLLIPATAAAKVVLAQPATE